MRRITIAALALALTGVVAAPAFAHQGDPHFDSVLEGTGIAGLKVQVLNDGDRLLFQNRTGKTVTLEGYQREPYARMEPNGTVQVNQRSPATYLNNDPYGNVTVPRSANPDAAPVWKTIEGDGRFETHDHRIHWMSKGVVPQVVHDTSKRTKVFDWAVPLEVGSHRTAIHGTLFWRGSIGGGMPVGAIAALVAFVLGSAALVAVVRRRRRIGGRRAPAPAADAEAGEAW
jgi:hypothetical protein